MKGLLPVFVLLFLALPHPASADIDLDKEIRKLQSALDAMGKRARTNHGRIPR